LSLVAASMAANKDNGSQKANNEFGVVVFQCFSQEHVVARQKWTYILKTLQK
jgi:hypothetical protein